MLDLACQDSSYENTMGYHENKKYMVKWETGKKNFHKGYLKTEEDLTERLKRNTYVPKKNNLETFLLKRKASFQIKCLLSD